MTPGKVVSWPAQRAGLSRDGTTQRTLDPSPPVWELVFNAHDPLLTHLGASPTKIVGHVWLGTGLVGVGGFGRGLSRFKTMEDFLTKPVFGVDTTV